MDHRGDTIQILHQFAEDELREDLNRQTNLNLQVSYFRSGFVCRKSGTRVHV